MLMLRLKTVAKAISIFGLAMAILSSPLWIPMIGNNLEARELRKLLIDTELPTYAKIVASRSRVFNGGNGDGCDYQAVLVLSYWGEFDKLRNAFQATISQYALSIPEATHEEVKSGKFPSWTAKISNHSTELSITPNVSTAGLYLIDLTVYARTDSLDPRCV